MCGIVGFAKQDSLGDLYEGLKTLEYRGYDSVGVAYVHGAVVEIRKRKGRVERLRAFLFAHHADVCMGHTRWATHGSPTAANAHPHRAGRWVVVHNGIISNYAELRHELTERGRRFASDTDTEVIAHLLDECTAADPLDAIERTVARLRGNWAVAALYEGTPDCVYLFKKGNPLIVGKGEGFCCFASDTPALVRYTRTIYKMHDGETARLSADEVELWRDGERIEPAYYDTTLHPDEVQLGRYPSYMRKEMAEIPAAVADTYRYVTRCAPTPIPADVRRVVLVGCGTAYHACLYARTLGLPISVDAVVASEFDPVACGLDEGCAVVAVSQSGETADTLDAVRRALSAGVIVWGVTNVPASGLTALVHHCVTTRAGAEIAVAATKSYATQLVALRYLFSQFSPMPMVEELVAASGTLAASLPTLDAVARRRVRQVFLLGKGRDYYTCLEGALKIKEVAYVPCDTCYAGEIKHGPLACVDRHTLVMVLSTGGEGDKMRTALSEVTTRGAHTLVIATDPALCELGDWGVALPSVAADWAPVLAVQPLQYLAYRMAVERGLDPDKPRNLAKSVTVE